MSCKAFMMYAKLSFPTYFPLSCRALQWAHIKFKVEHKLLLAPCPKAVLKGLLPGSAAAPKAADFATYASLH